MSNIRAVKIESFLKTAWYRLQSYVSEQAVEVDLAYTSQQCNGCSYTNKNNRILQSNV